MCEPHSGLIDIQSWWEIPSIAHFCSLFRDAFNLLDFSIEDFEIALLADGTEDPCWLQELIVRLLSGCLANNEISTFNYQMFLRRLFRQKCQEHDRYNPFNTDVDFQLLPVRTKVDILYSLCDFRLDADDVLDQLKNLEADSLRVEPLGYDKNESAYWYFYGTRLYREDFAKKNKKKAVWQVICHTEPDWLKLHKTLETSSVQCERQLYRTITENFLPELPDLFKTKESQARSWVPVKDSRSSSTLLLKELEEVDEEKDAVSKNEEKQKKLELEVRRRKAYERRGKFKETSEDDQSGESEERYEMAGAKTRQKKSKGRQRKLSSSSTNSKEAPKIAKRKKNSDGVSKSSTSASTTTVGRQTNNSLAAATGQIVIQPLAAPQKKKLKTSQVFRQTDEDLITGMHKILDYVKNHEDAWPFIDPVEEDYAPNYYTVIRKPMDLQRMEDRLDAGYYKNFSKFRDDFQLMVDNCRLYNGAENEYTEMVDNLLKGFERATEKFLDQISSSDDEIAVEYPSVGADPKDLKKIKTEAVTKAASKRKPTLAAKTDRKRDRSLSEESAGKRSNSLESLDNTKDEDRKSKKICSKSSKKVKNDKVKKVVKQKKNVKAANKQKKEKTVSPVRSKSPSRSRSSSPFRRGYSSSPPPSSAPSSPDIKKDINPKKQKTLLETTKNATHATQKGKHNKKPDKFKGLFDRDEIKAEDVQLKKLSDKPVVVPKPIDKHNKLRETIEKLKAKSEISHKLSNSEFCFDLDTSKENKEKPKKFEKDVVKTKKGKLNKPKKDLDFEDSNSTLESQQSDKKTKKPNLKNSGTKNAAIEALTIATEQTLKDINKWLDDTPKFSEFSSASNSPSYGNLDEFEISKVDGDNRKKAERMVSRKDGFGKDIKRRAFSRDPAKFLKRREIQRTIDRLQPGKGKGNLLSNVPTSKQADELFPLGPLSKNKDSKNALIVKTNDNAPKLSLGSVLDNFGRHKFVDDAKKVEDLSEVKPEIIPEKIEEVKDEGAVKEEKEDKKTTPVQEESAAAGPTPNLSAWFKAFGAPKVQSSLKKSDVKPDGKDSEKTDDKTVKDDKVPVPETSPSTDGAILTHGQPAARQRKISTGSSVSERSSFSQDMDSPRVGIDERLGAYPAPYPSPLHRSPSGASPVMVSPRPDVSPKAPYPPFNGQIRVGFYQDTVSTKSSPDKSCSPRDNPQSPYTQCSEHVYTPNTTAQSMPYSYPNSPYYSHPPSYSTTNPTPPYNPETMNSASYYDTNKSLTDQYQAKTNQGYGAGSPVQSPNPQNPPNVEAFRHEEKNEKLTPSAMFPVKKRAYNDSDSVQLRYDNSQEFINRNLTQLTQPGNEQEPMKQYIHQNIPEPKPLTVQTSLDNYNKVQSGVSPAQVVPVSQQQLDLNGMRNYPTPPNPYGANYSNESGYPLNIPSRSLASGHELERKLDMSKYTNMGYTGPEVNFSRSMQQYNRPELSYTRPNQQTSVNGNQPPMQQNPDVPLRYPNPNPHLQMNYKGMEMASSNPQQAHSNFANASNRPPEVPNRLQQSMDVQGGYKSGEVSIPRPTYNTHLEMDQPLGLRGNIANLSHIVDRYNNDDRMLSGLQPSAGQYYGDKSIGSGHMFNKPTATSASGLPMFSQPMQTYNQSMQSTTSSMYSRQLTELQSPIMSSNDSKTTAAQGTEKKSKKRKSSKTVQAASAAEPQPPNPQGFQSYAGLKSTASMEPSAISLKTASVVPGSAFNFGPTPTGLSIGSGLYGDKDAYPNFLDDFRAAPNYYMAAAAAAHHRATPETSEKQTRVAHQSSAPQAPSYPFIGAPQGRPPSYPLSSPFMPSQAQLMDPNGPLYQHYLQQAGVLNQGLLGPPGPYPPGYHPALSMRQPYDSMTRPSWL